MFIIVFILIEFDKTTINFDSNTYFIKYLFFNLDIEK